MANSEFVAAGAVSVQSDVLSSGGSTTGHASVVLSNVDSGNPVEVVAALELGFSAVVLSVGLIAGFVLSKIVNWWKW